MQGVSIIIPVFNREVFLKEAIESILVQEYDGPMEIIVADDGSTDRSIEVAESFGHPVKVLRKPSDCTDQGPGPTRNRAIAESTMPYIAFLDSDDLFLPGHIKRLASALEANPKIGWVIDQLCGGNSDGKNRWNISYPEQNTISLKTVFLNPYILLQASMTRKSLLQQLPYIFDKDLLMAEDIDLILRILEKNNGVILPENGAVVREHDARSVRNIRKTYMYANLAMQKAIIRHNYRKSLIRHRKAVIQFRFAQADLQEKKYISGICRLIWSVCLDPIRACKELVGIHAKLPVRQQIL
ncbi:MAG: glycosyltransferase family 2 protein [Thermoguttaceae bacterium]